MSSALYEKVVICDENKYGESLQKIREITGSTKCPYCKKTSEFLLRLAKIENAVCDDYFQNNSFDDLLKENNELYKEVIGENYNSSFVNTKYSVDYVGEKIGFELSYVSYAVHECITAAYEHNKALLLHTFNLFLEVYELISVKTEDIKTKIRNCIADYEMKRTLLNNEIDMIKQNDSNYSNYTNITLKSDLSDLRYLFKYGKYISENEIGSAKYLNSLDDEVIQKMADAYTQPFIDSFARYGKKFDGFDTVLLAYPVGFERVIFKSIENFRKYGMESCVCNILFCTKPNKQMKYDHRLDDSLYLSEEYVDAVIENQTANYEKYKDIVSKSAGYGMKCTFGEELFSPVVHSIKLEYADEQKKLKSKLTMSMFKLKSKNVPRSKTSYTAIGYPIPVIGKNYKEIFGEMIKINTLDNDLYASIHQNIISVLDQADYVKVLGTGNNRTNLSIKMQRIDDIEKQTNFFNCIASVNVPVGEVFTSPQLKGTNGTLHVSGVYLMGLLYKDLEIEFKDGVVVDYTCKNFDNEADNKSYIKENLLAPHDSLPMGEFAIGTNTMAYAMAKKYNISELLPILIAEKTGPHFAIGDTCYRGREALQVFNQDGREITAKGNEYGEYTGKHIDITIPFEEIGEISIEKNDKDKVYVIKDGLFIGDNMEELNQYLK